MTKKEIINSIQKVNAFLNKKHPSDTGEIDSRYVVHSGRGQVDSQTEVTTLSAKDIANRKSPIGSTQIGIRQIH